MDRVPRKAQPQARELLKKIPYADSLEEARKKKEKFQRWARSLGYESAADLLDQDWERMTTFYRYPKAHWVHLRTTSPIESPFSVVQLRTHAAKRYKKVLNASAVIWKTLRVAEKRFRPLRAPKLLKEVFEGAD